MIRSRIVNVLHQGKDGDSVVVAGWVKTKRVSKKFAFVVLNDGSCQSDLQVIVDEGSPGFRALDRISTGASVKAVGQLKKSPGKGQAWEVHAQEMDLVGLSASDYPLQKKGHSLEFLREVGHLRGRTNTFGAVFRIRNKLSWLVHRFFQEKGFMWAHTPIVTTSDCEGAGEMFRVTTLNPDTLPRNDKGDIDYGKDFFGAPSYLTVSGQLNGESMALSFGDIYTFGPTFRAENSNTTRHLSEFWMIEPEMAFATLKEDMILAEEFLKFIFSGVLRECPDELEFLSKNYNDCDVDQLATLSSSAFSRLSYTDAIEELSKSSKNFEFPVEWGVDLKTEHERFLTEIVCKGPVIVTDYPKDIKAFYMKLNSDHKTVAAMDVLVPRIGELIGGSQREDNADLLTARLNEVGGSVGDLSWYMDLRRYGGCPHAGFGLGFERLVQYVTGMTNIRDVIPFPRAPKSAPF